MDKVNYLVKNMGIIQNSGDKKPPQNPPDLDEIWADFQRKISKLFSNSGKKLNNRTPVGGDGGNGTPFDGKGGRIFVLVVVILLLLWLGSGLFVVTEGQRAVITRFGQYQKTVGAGLNWRLPYPIERHEIVTFSEIKSLDIGSDNKVAATGLRDSAMLTQDENIVEIKFSVQYRLKNAQAYLFETRNPVDAIKMAAQTAVREVVGKMKLDAALSEEKDQIAVRVKSLMQTILDRYKTGVDIVGINLQDGAVRPPEKVQAAFDDVLRAGQERERKKNEAQTYFNEEVPKAEGVAARMMEDAQAYKSKIVAQAQGDAQRFDAIFTQYKKSPQVMRDRLYIDTMQQIYGNAHKIIVDTKQGGNMLYLPLDKLMVTPKQSMQPSSQSGEVTNSTASTSNANTSNTVNENRQRDTRARDERQ